MTLQQRAAALWKWGNRYPALWPKHQEWAAEAYRQDRVERGLE